MFEGWFHAQLGDYVKALEHYLGWKDRARIYFQLDEAEKSRGDIKRILEYEPDHEEALYLLYRMNEA